MNAFLDVVLTQSIYYLLGIAIA